MSYTRGTNAGRLRELIGDTREPHTFTDGQIDDGLTTYGSVPAAAIFFLFRLHNDESLLLRHFERVGHNQDSIERLQQRLMQQVTALREGALSYYDSSPDWEPSADKSDLIGQYTNSDGLRKRTPIDNIMEESEGR